MRITHRAAIDHAQAAAPSTRRRRIRPGGTGSARGATRTAGDAVFGGTVSRGTVSRGTAFGRTGAAGRRSTPPGTSMAECWASPARNRRYASRRPPLGDVRPHSHDRTVAGVTPNATPTWRVVSPHCSRSRRRSPGSGSPDVRRAGALSAGREI
ncbi:hypothetical protein ACFW2T_12905 [Streptomyces sp. NPDC058892]|uniref:hypothetical protein n=1 Tax=unclassified Streptomyces TaxID=2593676 RepID=UPI000B1A2875|nr:hypothetical protein [Streptomyces sp. PCS3-D2]WKV70403.1 hypothetical protein AW27_002055 [Streptomyces sp. PCS3-D2]